MPKTPINYDNTCLYKIVCRDLEVKETYVGRTTDFRRRKYDHKHSCITEHGKSYNLALYEHIRNNGGWDNFDMVLIEQCKCDGSLDAHKKQRELIEQLGSKLNMLLPARTKQELRDGFYSKHPSYNKEY